MSNELANSTDIVNLEKAIECSLCLSLICEPITISCGHSFCKCCLVNALKRAQKKCPQCRAVCHVNAETAEENVMLKSIATLLNPTLYNLRLAESEKERTSWNTLLPIFYYNSTLAPGSRLSLHLFEPRYKLMIRRIVDTSRSFAYVPNFTNYVAKVDDIALIAEIKECEFLADGRVLLEAEIKSRHMIVDHFVESGTQGLHFCRLEELHDELVASEDLPAIGQLISDVERILSMLFSGEIMRQIIETCGPKPSVHNHEMFSLWLSGILPLKEKDKCELLKLKSTRLRLQRCIESLQTVIQSFSNGQSLNTSDDDS